MKQVIFESLEPDNLNACQVAKQNLDFPHNEILQQKTASNFTLTGFFTRGVVISPKSSLRFPSLPKRNP